MIVGGLKTSTNKRRYRKDKCEIQLIHTKPSQPCIGQSSRSHSSGLITRSTPRSQVLPTRLRAHSRGCPAPSGPHQ
jgi:hypothetical protein